MKLNLLLLASALFFSQLIVASKSDTKKISLEIMEALSDDIAELVIAKKQEKNDPAKTKAHCINIIKHMANIIALIVETIKERKQTRSIVLWDQNDQDLLIEEIAQKILQEIENAEKKF